MILARISSRDTKDVDSHKSRLKRSGDPCHPVVKGITETLVESPEDMAIKNQGIYLLVEDAAFNRATGGNGQLTITLADPARHGIVNGGHTHAAIRDAIENADETERKNIFRDYVRLHIL
jgi:hypothetical protein